MPVIECYPDLLLLAAAKLQNLIFGGEKILAKTGTEDC